MLGVNLMVFMATLDMSIVNVSLPTLVEQLNTDFAIIQWVVLSYILVVASLLLLVSRLGDIKGKKAIFTWGMVIFTAGSLLCGLAPNVSWLIAFRAVQGVGAAMSQALGIAIVTEIATPGTRGRAIGFIGATVSLGLALGPSIGGIMIGVLGWRSIFLINVPIGLFAFHFVHSNLPTLPPVREGQRFDPAGAVISALTLAAYSLGMTWGQKQGFDHGAALALLGVAALGLGLFIIVEQRVPEPMIDLGLFANRLFTLNLIMAVLAFISLAGVFIMPFFLQMAQGYSIQQVGLMMMVIPLAMGITAPVAGSLSDAFGSRGISVVGLLIMAGGCFAVSTLTMDTPWWGYVLRAVPLGLGVGIFQAPNNSAIMGAVPTERLGVASGLLNYSRVFGQSTGIPLVGAIFTTVVLSIADLPERTDFSLAPPEALAAGVTGAYRIQGIIILLAVLLAVYSWRLAKKQAARSPWKRPPG
ncbi:MAG: DHA2 family efflux MFS transporter permease subunit [Deltaproteobacteria bacterium]|nr:DHA2 family efflux MFS transporter permease subunit [Deltaproteobacteria bacterium]